MNKVNSLCGLSKHIASSEQYIYDTSYYSMSEIAEVNLDFSMSIGEDFATTKTNLERSITKIVMNFEAVQILSSHFPEIRYIKRLLYDLMALDAKLNNLDKALNESDVNLLPEISKETQENAAAHREKFTEINLNEDDIKSQYFLAFKAFTKRSIDIPKWPCISCEKLSFERNVTRIKICNKTYGSKLWRKLLQHIDYKENDTAYICQYCKSKICFNIMPPTCILNNLDARKVPEEIENLNDYERILIQRAKAFQTVLRMGTAMNKNIPHRGMIPKVKGRTFHLPLPLEETFEKICPSHVPINVNHELYILVRGIPTKSNIVWENLVDVDKVWNALLWLKDNNPLYSETVLPISSDGLLLQSSLKDTEFQIDNDLREDDEIFEKINDKEKENNALVTQKSQSDSYYDQYTIYPMYEGRTDKSATELYQMLKVHDHPLDCNYKLLDVMCFPDLFPYGINGQRENRSVRLSDFEFIKSRLMSKHSRFRLNIQYLFYLLHDCNIRNINAGIFHKLNITNPREKYTASSYLEKLSKHQLETNLNTIFARLRNTPQCWIRPRCMLKCMIYNYGPATWFLTLSPSEWLWSDMIEYLREINSPKSKTMSINELIASDPVSVSRFIKNKFQAINDFITSPDNPIEEVSHYFIRREYQGRGTQHFHKLIWIKDAPIIDVSSNEDVAAFILKDVAVSMGRRKKLKIKNRLYDLPRSQEEININDYNPAILCALEGNMNIQFVGEISTLLTWYTTKYVSNSEKSNITGTLDVINSTKSIRSDLWNVGMRMLNNRESGALEAAEYLLGIPLFITDPTTTIRRVDVNMISSRKLESLNHYHYNLQTQPEAYFYALLLLFKPWRNTDELKCGCDRYAEAFVSVHSELMDGLKYHERILEIQKGMDYMKELINKNIEECNEGDKCSNDLTLECVPIEVEAAMKDFQDVQNKYEDLDVLQMISELNSDQKRVFDKVTETVSTDNEILRLYVSGEGGTGKSFLIKTIRCWIKKTMKKDVIVSAPTGIAAFNIDGQTIHRVFQLPVDHGRTAKYTGLSDVAIKIIREELKNVTLIIIDEISMISNVTLMYIHLRLVEIFNTKDLDNGWFGGKHILFFGDLLQLPPVRDKQPFIKLSNIEIENYIGTLGFYDLWTNLFSYDELTINMRQKTDNTYKDILSSIRIGIVQYADTQILLSKKINFKSIKIEDRMQELCDFISVLSSDTVCLLPTCS
ncbi:uncharacterized protein [Prorops nasuta]|uniref:uncharacterized protein n=1 Tax=Prorops nasuta TaxID=863751 RepID=UPI0034CD1F55